MPTLSTIPNVLALAAENPPSLLPLLRSNPTLAPAQDEHGYSLLHAAASYNHLDLARALKTEFNIDSNLVDEDGETALFVAETVEVAQCLLEEIGTDPEVKNAEGFTAEERIRGEGDFIVVADYLKEARTRRAGGVENGASNALHGIPNGTESERPPPLPPGVQLRVGGFEDEQNLGEVADPELRRRIEELAARDNFQGEEGQQQLRDLITDAVRGVSGDQREVRRRFE